MEGFDQYLANLMNYGPFWPTNICIHTRADVIYIFKFW